MWTRLAETSLWDAAITAHATPEGRRYHVFDHPMALYEVAEIRALPYSLALDIAILYHDSIYEGRPDDVFESARLMIETVVKSPEFKAGMITEKDVREAAGLIMTTEDHAPGKDNRLILLDLSSIADPRRADKDYELIAEEMAELKGASREEFVAGNAAFMRDLKERIISGLASSDVHRNDVDGFLSVIEGINRRLAKAEPSDAAPSF